MDTLGTPLLSDWTEPDGVIKLAELSGTSFRFFLGLLSSGFSSLLFWGAKLWRTKNDWMVADKKEVTTFLF